MRAKMSWNERGKPNKDVLVVFAGNQLKDLAKFS